MKNKFYVTTPIYYVNAVPHLGSAYTTIAADVLARYYRGKYGAENVFFMTGTDEHGAKIQEMAETAGKTPKVFTDEIVAKFKTAWENLDIDYDNFLRTTDKQHEEAVAWVTQKLYDQGDIYKGSYEALYCVGCEQYKTKSELIEGNICPDHNRECEIHEEEAYLFALSKYQDELEKRISTDEISIRPEARKNEILTFIRGGLEDVAISRKKENVYWGIDLPFDKTHTTYVWVDAFLNYLTGLGWPADTKKSDKFWPADVQLMAKDIARVHATLWQAMLLALKLPTSKQLFVHGYFTIDGKKMSKSLGNVLEPNALVEKFGADAVRYAVLREFPFGSDGDISEEKIAVRYTSDLANGIGNLLQRTLTIINNNKLTLSDIDVQIQDGLFQDPTGEATLTLDEKISLATEKLKFHEALTLIWVFRIRLINQYFEEMKPWELAKFDQAKLVEVLQVCYFQLKQISKNILPFMPETSEKMKKQLETLKPEPLFPRIDIVEVKSGKKMEYKF